MTLTPEELALLRRIDDRLRVTNNYLAGMIGQLDILGEQMTEQTSELDQAVADLQTAVQGLTSRIQDQGALLGQIANLNAQIDVLQADDAADDAEIARLKAQRDAAVTDAQENVRGIGAVTEQINALGQPQAPAEPVDDVPTDDGEPTP
jgi:chromosome segregation ATPase